MNKITPMIDELNRIYKALNEHYFDDELPEVFITIYPGKKKSQSSYGMFTPESWAKWSKKEEPEYDDYGNEIVEKSEIQHEIAMSAEYFTRPVANWVGTLVHEMVHLYCFMNDIEDTSNNGRYHNKRFKVEAEKRGLIIEKADIIGWSVTTPSVELINFVNTLDIDEEKFKYFRDTKLLESNKAKKVRWVCPVCGCQAQAKKTVRLMCGECMKIMDLWNLTDPDNLEILEDYNDGLAFSEDGWLNNID